MSEYFPKPSSHEENIKVKIHLTNYATKEDVVIVVKKTVNNKLVAKVDNNNTNDFVLKTKYSTDKTELENKISDIKGLVTKAKLNVVENKIPRASDLVT